MSFINNNEEIMTSYVYPNDGIISVVNDTNFFPLCICCDIILMSDKMLYKINKKNSSRCTLEVIKMSTNKKYAVEEYDFTNCFVKIKTKCYEVRLYDNKLCEIPIVAKKSNCIAGGFFGYYYVNLDNKLMLYDKYKKTHSLLDDDVDVILFSGFIRDRTLIAYKKTNRIIYSTYAIDGVLIISSNIVDYKGLPIVKILNYSALDSGGTLYRFIPCINMFIIEKMLENVVDFNTLGIDDEVLYILKSDNKIYRVDGLDYSIKYVCQGGYFTKKKWSAKSANNVYKKM